ncbi:beta-ketoacyl synthase N-terminal-like domain-containing protein [Kitasatospora griseola]|uniref:beta-ketoacyl synthase N-terminal-like domain-containing protein n=1 Tax=Kitasatospora griseola TaxID=2064 RepID=UPI0037F2DF15
MNRLRTLATASWTDGEPPPPLPGFSASAFNPLVAAVAERCLTEGYGEPGEPRRTGLLLASAGGDRATASAIDTGAAGRRMPPLLFFQSNPNAVLGHIAARWNLTGPVVAISPPAAAAPGEVPPEALELAALLLADGDADQILVVSAEQAQQDRQTQPAEQTEPAEPHERAEQAAGEAVGSDHATAVLVTAA